MCPRKCYLIISFPRYVPLCIIFPLLLQNYMFSFVRLCSFSVTSWWSFLARTLNSFWSDIWYLLPTFFGFLNRTTIINLRILVASRKTFSSWLAGQIRVKRKGVCHDDFVVLDQFFAKTVTWWLGGFIYARDVPDKLSLKKSDP